MIKNLSWYYIIITQMIKLMSNIRSEYQSRKSNSWIEYFLKKILCFTYFLKEKHPNFVKFYKWLDSGLVNVFSNTTRYVKTCHYDQFSEQRKSWNFFFCLLGFVEWFICGETSVYHIIYHESIFYLWYV